MLVPAYPMDCAQTIQGLVWWRTDYRTGLRVACVVGCVTGAEMIEFIRLCTGFLAATRALGTCRFRALTTLAFFLAA